MYIKKQNRWGKGGGVEKRLFNLYWKLVKAGYVEFNKKKQTYVAADVGVPQGGIVSPLLSNLMLHELDVYMEKRKLEREASSHGHVSFIQNSPYKQLTYTISKCVKAKSRADLRKEERAEIRTRLYTALQHRKLYRAKLPNPNVTRIDYVRYADD